MNEEPKKENKAEAAIAGQGSFLLSKEQKTRLILAAQDAFREQIRAGMYEDTKTGFEEFRRGALADVCGKVSFRSVMQSEFLPALNYFRKLSGKSVVEKKQLAAYAGGDERSRALWKLEQTYSELADRYGGAGGAAVYAEACCQRIYHCGIDKANAKQLWCLVFTLRNRNKKKEAR